MFDSEKRDWLLSELDWLSQNTHGIILGEDDFKTTVIYNARPELVKCRLDQVKELIEDLLKERNEYLNKLDAVITKFMKEDSNENY